MNDNDDLISIDRLAPLDAEVRERVLGLNLPFTIDLTDENFGLAFCRSLLFEHWPELVEENIPSDIAFYNRYYWFVRFIALYQKQQGTDEGLEQQAFQLLEEADFDLDWDKVQNIEGLAREIE